MVGLIGGLGWTAATPSPVGAAETTIQAGSACTGGTVHEGDKRFLIAWGDTISCDVTVPTGQTGYLRLYTVAQDSGQVAKRGNIRVLAGAVEVFGYIEATSPDAITTTPTLTHTTGNLNPGAYTLEAHRHPDNGYGAFVMTHLVLTTCAGTGVYCSPAAPVATACGGDLVGTLEAWGGYGGGGAWGASAPDGKSLWELVQQSFEEAHNPKLLWKNLKAENPELVGLYESYEGWFWAQYDDLTGGWLLKDSTGAAVDREAVGFGAMGGGGAWGITCDVDEDYVPDPPAASPASPAIIINVTYPPTGGVVAPPTGGCDFGLLDPSSWLCGLGGLIGQLIDLARSLLRAVLGLIGDLLELLADLFIPGPGTFDKLGELKTAFTTHPPGSILVGGGQFVGGLATGLEGAGCAAGPDFSPDGFEGLMQLPGQCEGSGFGMLDLLYGFVTVCLYASLMWSLWYLAESHFGVGMEA